MPSNAYSRSNSRSPKRNKVHCATNTRPGTPVTPPPHEAHQCFLAEPLVCPESPTVSNGVTVVVGAGLTGLVAAYELAKAGKQVYLIERTEFVGGNIRSIRLGTTDDVVDFGTQAFYKSDTNMTELLAELNLTQYTTATSSHSHLIHRNRGYAEAFVPHKPRKYDHHCTDSDTECEPRQSSGSGGGWSGVFPFPSLSLPEGWPGAVVPQIDAYQPLNMWTLAHLVPELPGIFHKLLDLLHADEHAPSIYHPNTHKVAGNVSLAEYLSHQPQALQTLQTLLRSQVRGFSTELPAFLTLPALLRLPLNDEFNFGGNAHLLSEALVEGIRARGGKVLVATRAININTLSRSIDVMADKDRDLYEIPFESCVLACPLGSVTINDKDIFRDANPVDTRSNLDGFRYTSKAVVCLELDGIPTTATAGKQWAHILEGNTFNPAHRFEDDIQIVEVTNLEHTRGVKNCVLVTVASLADDQMLLTRFFSLNGGRKPEILSKLTSLLQQTDLFKQQAATIRVRDLVHFQILKGTGQVLNHAMWQHMRQFNETASTGSRVWFAGRYLCASAGMEASCYAGRSVASQVLGADAATAYEQRMERANRCVLDAVRMTVGLHCVAAPGALAGLAVVGIGSLCGGIGHLCFPRGFCGDNFSIGPSVVDDGTSNVANSFDTPDTTTLKNRDLLSTRTKLVNRLRHCD